MYIIVSTENIELCFAVFIYRNPCYAAQIIQHLAFFTQYYYLRSITLMCIDLTHFFFFYFSLSRGRSFYNHSEEGLLNYKTKPRCHFKKLTNSAM